MRFSSNLIIAIAAGVTAASAVFLTQAGADEKSPPVPAVTQQADAVFAGGCFWCVEADFDKLDGVLETISGYTGGDLDNPSYEDVSHKKTGHYEAVRVIYDPSVVSYDELLDYYWHHVDPTDAGGQFCDRGDSYRTAIFVEDEAEREEAEASKDAIDASGVLPGPIVTPILERKTFWPAESYHQNYHNTHSLKYKYYRTACGRDARVRKVWSGETS